MIKKTKIEELVPSNVKATSVIQDGQMYILEEAIFKDTGDYLDKSDIDFINVIPDDGNDWDRWLMDWGSSFHLSGHIHFD